jgi:hypothetical protein
MSSFGARMATVIEEATAPGLHAVPKGAMKTKTLRTRSRNRLGSRAVTPRANGPLNGRSLEEYVLAQGAVPFDHESFAKSFEGIIPPGEDMGAFVDEIYKART